jgi:hypothetical protein
LDLAKIPKLHRFGFAKLRHLHRIICSLNFPCYFHIFDKEKIWGCENVLNRVVRNTFFCIFSPIACYVSLTKRKRCFLYF